MYPPVILFIYKKPFPTHLKFHEVHLKLKTKSLSHKSIFLFLYDKLHILQALSKIIQKIFSLSKFCIFFKRVHFLINYSSCRHHLKNVFQKSFDFLAFCEKLHSLRAIGPLLLEIKSEICINLGVFCGVFVKTLEVCCNLKVF